MLYIILALAGSCPIHPLLLLAVMLPRRRLRNTTPNYASQQQASGSVDDGQRSDLVTNQTPPRGPSAQTSTAESPVSEAPTLGIPTRRGTHEPYNPTSEPKSPQQESGPAHYEAEGISKDIHARVWPIYNKVFGELDEKTRRQLSEDLDVLLIFVSLSVRMTIPSG